MSLLPMGAWPQMSGTGEAVLFWIVGSLMVCGALGVLLFRKAAYAVLSMVVVMVGMAILFFALEAPFNASVQVIVYTGAILMLFLFVIMMIGLGATDGYLEQRRGFIWAGVLFGGALAVLLVSAVVISTVPGPGRDGRDCLNQPPTTVIAPETGGVKRFRVGGLGSCCVWGWLNAWCPWTGVGSGAPHCC